MRKDLLDKEVIVAYDIRQVQRFLFGGTTIYDYTGANDILATFFYDAFNYCVKHPTINFKKNEYSFDESIDKPVPYFHDKNVKMQVISIGGGNAFMLYRTGRIAEKINRLFSSFLLKTTYSLEIAIAAVEKTNNMERDNNKLYLELDRSKNNGVIPFPLSSIAVCDVEGTTGYPTTYRGHNYIANHSTVSHIKRIQTIEGTYNHDEFKNTFSSSDNRLVNFELVRDNSPTIGYVHMDGNSMGMTIARIKRGVTDYEEGVILSRKIQLNIQAPMKKVLADVQVWLKKVLIANHEKNPNIEAHLAFTHIGGDDINFFCDYHYALSIVEYISNALSKMYMWNDERIGKIPFSVCAGVAFCSKNIDDFSGKSLAEECCSIAKKEAKKSENLIDGRVGSWVYFQDCKFLQNFDFKEVLEQDYVLSDGSSLCLRPYCLNKEYKNDIRHFSTFKKYYHLLEKEHLSPFVLNYLRKAFTHSKIAINTSVQQLKKNDRSFPDALMTTFIKVPTRDNDVALWFDALEFEGCFYDVYKEE